MSAPDLRSIFREDLMAPWRAGQEDGLWSIRTEDGSQVIAMDVTTERMAKLLAMSPHLLFGLDQIVEATRVIKPHIPDRKIVTLFDAFDEKVSRLKGEFYA